MENHSQYFGFTLIEILIVIGILAILGAIIFLFLTPLEYFGRSRDAIRIQNLQAIDKILTTAKLSGVTGGGR